MKCPNCHKEVSSEWLRCPYCDYKPNLCSKAECTSGWLLKETHFCPLCGSPVKGEENLRLKEIIAKTIAEAASIVSSNYSENSSDSSELSFNIGGVSFKMIRVEGGSFMMGLPDNDSDAYDEEKPQHRVMISDYYIGETQVTQALWKAVMGNYPSNSKGDNLPVETVSWNDSQEFIKQLNKKTGKTFCLPTEAQWEYAARGGRNSQGFKYAGSNVIDKVAWYCDNGKKIHPVKHKTANELGLYDMSGNVWEWCQDWEDDYSCSDQTDPQGPSSGSYRVLRGGGYCSGAGYCRVAYRNYSDPGYRSGSFGFRLALVHQ